MTSKNTAAPSTHGGEEARTLWLRIHRTPYGYGGVVYQRSPFRLRRIHLPRPTVDDLHGAVGRLRGLRPEPEACREAEEVIGAMADYYGGRPLTPPWHWMALGELTPLQREVLRAVAGIPFGEVRSYGAVAEAVGRPRAHRFVGTTVARNPFPILIPCHRVVRSDGDVGRFGGGTALKRALLALEGGLDGP